MEVAVAISRWPLCSSRKFEMKEFIVWQAGLRVFTQPRPKGDIADRSLGIGQDSVYDAIDSGVPAMAAYVLN